MLESSVEDYLLTECALYGALCVKNQRVVRGWPDRSIYWWDCAHDLVETKRPKGGKFEPLQLRTHSKLRERGHSVFVINTHAQVDSYIRLRREFWSPFRRKKLEHLRTR